MGGQATRKYRDLVFKNTLRDIEKILRFSNSNSTRFDFECYDISHLYNLAHFVNQGLTRPSLFVQFVFGLLGGIVAHTEDLAYMKRTADQLFGDDYQWSLLGAGKNQILWPLLTPHSAATYASV